MVKDRYRQGEGQHCDVMHRPDAKAHHNGATGEPDDSQPIASSRDSAREVEGSIRRKHGKHYRQRHQLVIVSTRENQSFGRSASPLSMSTNSSHTSATVLSDIGSGGAGRN